MNRKKVIFSAIQPSGAITLGNYLGALKNWIALQDNYEALYALADLHAITVWQEPATFRKNIYDAYALLLAMGIDHKKSIFFVQSHVPEHAQLAWILNCFTQFGELSRMTQFKDKARKHADNVNVGLFTYPALMAADILLYQADLVPVGIDQTQHLELTRNIAERFNAAYSTTFTVPESYIMKNGAKIMSLQNPKKKMSKSDENINAYVSLLDKPDDVIRKFKRAVTDCESCVRYAEGKDGISNLMEIYGCITGKDFDAIEKEFEGKGYGYFKMAVGEVVVDHLRPIQAEYARLIVDKSYLDNCFAENAIKASRIASKTLGNVMKKVGFLSMNNI